MSNKKKKPQVINNIQELNLEIDYDKLAEAIVKANSSQEEILADTRKKNKLSIRDFFKIAGYIIFNKKQSDGTITSRLIGEFLALLFNAFAVASVIVLCCTVYFTIATISHFIWTTPSLIVNNILLIVVMITFPILITGCSLLFRGMANEMAAEKDRNYIISVFSGIVSFAALIVALVALFKGVG